MENNVTSEEPTGFSEKLKKEIAQPDPSGEGIAKLKNHLIHVYLKLKEKLSQKLNKKLSWGEREFVAETEEREVSLAIAELLSRYRKARLSSHVTQKSAQRVLNRVRTQCRREMKWVKRWREIDDEELAKEPIFDTWLDRKVEDLEHLFEQGVIDKVEYYFLLAVGEGFGIQTAGELIDSNDSTARWCLCQARKKVQQALEDLNAGRTPKPGRSRGRRRQKVSEETLNWAIQHVLTR